MASKPKPRKFTPIIKKLVPKREIDQEIISLISVTIADGDIDRLKSLVNNKNVTFDVVDEQGNTPIHMVLMLDDSKVTQLDKLEMVKFLHRNGCPVGRFNKNNVTPLHLAAKLQNKDIVKYILKHGTLLDHKDNNYMTPLHYAVQGDPVKCKTKKRTDERSKNVVSHENLENTIKDINQLVGELLNQDYQLDYLKHICSTIGQYKQMNLYKIHDILNRFEDKKNKIIQETSISSRKKQKKLGQLSEDYKNSIKNTIRNDLPLSLSKSYPQSSDITNDYIFEYNNKIAIQMYKIISNFQNETRELVGGLDGITGNTLNAVRNTYVIHQRILEHNYNFNINVEAIYGNLPSNHILYQDLKSMLSADTQSVMMYEIPDEGDENSPEIIGNDTLAVPSNIDSVIRGTSKQIKMWKNHYDVEEYELSYDDGYVATGPNMMEMISRASYFDPSAYYNYTFNPDNFPDNDFYISNEMCSTSKLGVYLDRTMLNLKSFNDNLTSLTENISNPIDNNFIHYAVVKYYIPFMIVNLINVCQNIAMIQEEKKFVLQRLQPISEILGSVFNKNIDYDYIYSIEYAKNYLDKIIDTVKSIQADKMFEYVKKLYDSLNNIIDIINLNSGLKISSKFLSSPLESSTISTVSHYVDKPIDKLRKFPESLKDYIETINLKDLSRGFDKNKYDEVVANIHNNLSYTIHPYNFYSYVLDSEEMNKKFSDVYPTLQNKVSSVYLGDGNTIHTSEVQIASAMKPKSNTVYLFDNINTDYLAKYLGVDRDYNITYTERNSNVLRVGTTFPGTIGIKRTESFNKSGPAPDCIKSVLDEHITSIKRRLFYHITQILTNSTYTNDFQKIKNSMKYLLTQLTNESDKDFFTLTILIQITDTIIMNYINECINRTATNIAENISKKPDAVDTVYIPDTDLVIDFKNSAQDQLEQLLEKYMTKNNVPDEKLILNSNISQEFEIPKNQYELLNTGYSRTEQVTDTDCIIIDTNVVKMLLDKGASPNQRDSEHMTPLFYSVLNLDPERIDLLLEYHAKVSTNSARNRSGLTPIDYIKKSIKDRDISTSRFYKNSLEEIEKSLRDNKKFDGSISYLETSFQQILYMINHSLYLDSKEYNNWTHDDHKSLCYYLEKNGSVTSPCGSSLVNILNVSDIEISKLSQNNTINKPLLDEKQRLQERQYNLEDRIKEFDEAIEELKKELQEEEKEEDETGILFTKGRMGKIISKNKANRNELDTISKKLLQLERNIAKGIKKNRVGVSDRMDSFVKSSKNVSMMWDDSLTRITKLYKSVFNSVINNVKTKRSENMYTGKEDYKAYNNLWKKYLESDRRYCIENITTVCERLEKKLLEDSTVGHEEVFTKINKLYSGTIKPFAKDYLELSQDKLFENYALYTVVSIITHVVRHTLCSAMYLEIINKLALYLTNVVPKTKYTDTTKTTIIDKILNRLFSDENKLLQDLCNYIVGYIPKVTTKYVLNVWFEFDEVNGIKSLNQITDNILDIILKNKIIDIKDDSELIIELRENTIPKYIELFNLCIPRYKTSVDNFMRYQINHSKELTILSKLLEKSKKEF